MGMYAFIDAIIDRWEDEQEDYEDEELTDEGEQQ